MVDTEAYCVSDPRLLLCAALPPNNYTKKYTVDTTAQSHNYVYMGIQKHQILPVTWRFKLVCVTLTYAV